MKKNLIMNALILILLVAAAVCGFFYFQDHQAAQEEIKEFTELRQTYTKVTDAPVCESSDPTEATIETGLPRVENDFESLLLINPDTVGWIMIPDTVISYPVVQTTNNTKYLDLSYGGYQTKAGTLFINKDNDLETLDSNTIIYGHNMGAGRYDMFSTLLSYKNEEFLQKHQNIRFDTIYRLHGWWEIFAIIELNISNTDFNYQQIHFDDEVEFMEWIIKAISLSIHETDVDVSSDSHILTLSTCDRSKFGRNGRLIVLAVRSFNN